MTEYLLVTRALLQGLHQDIESDAAAPPDLKSLQGARRNLLRIIANGEASEHSKPLPAAPVLNEQMAERLKRAERLLRRCEPLIVEGAGRYITVGSVVHSIEQFLKELPVGVGQ